jgi:ketosteroid isomerase-like protein
MHTRTLIAAAVAAALLSTGCAKPTVEAPAVDIAAEEQAIRDRSMEWLKFSTAKDAAGIANGILAASSVTMYDGVINEGVAAVQAASEAGYAARPNATTTWVTDEVHVAASGDLAYELGTSTEDADGDGEAAPTNGRYVTVWTKADGSWRAVVDAGTTPKPAEAAAPAT